MMKYCVRRVIVSAFLALLCGRVAPAIAFADDAQPAEVEITKITVGIDGHYRVGCWTPLSVTFEGTLNGPVHLDIWVPDSDGNLTRQPSSPAEVSGAGSQTLHTIFRTGRMDGVIRVEVATAESVLAKRTVRADVEHDPESVTVRPPHTLHTEIWALLGHSTGYEQAAEIINDRDGSKRDGDRSPVTLIPLADPAELPTLPDGLDAIDVLVTTGPMQWDESTDRAIKRWVEHGGHLVVSVGRQQDWDASPFADWVPIHLLGESNLNDLTALTTRLSRPDRFRGRSFQALQFEYSHGETLAGTRDGPLWVRLPLSMGQITLLGMDLGERPFVGWDTLPQLCEIMTDYQRPSKRDRRESGVAQLSRTGVSDLSTQLAVAVDQYPELSLQSNWMTMGLVLLYLVIIGPIDYLIVRYILKRPQFTWVTFPLVILASVYLATSSSEASHAREIISNQVHLIDVDSATGMTRATVWSSFVSPQTKRHSVEAEFTPLLEEATSPADTISEQSPTRLCWLGIPENGYRGMYRTGGLALARPRYAFAPGLTSIESVPVNIWSSSSHTATRFDRTNSPGELIECRLSDGSGQLEGTLTNHLPVAIDDWFIAHENLVYYPKGVAAQAGDSSIGPGNSLDLSRETYSPNILRNFLTGVTHVDRTRTRSLDNDFVVLSETYDPLSRDYYRLFRAVSFYRACGGAEFTSLSNDQFENLDLSPMLSLDRAVLFGRVSIPAAEIIVDGERIQPTETETLIRVLLPVD